jgi:MOSC domain-containing protein YiiM
MPGWIRALSVAPEKGTRPALRDTVQVTPDGFEGDHHTGHSRRRQILLVSSSVLDEFDLHTGDLHENAVIEGIDVMSLREGQPLRLGTALVAVTIPCEPCIQMERVRTGLRAQLKDCRGMFVRVLEPGIVSVGDPVSEG